MQAAYYSPGRQKDTTPTRKGWCQARRDTGDVRLDTGDVSLPKMITKEENSI